MNTFMGWLDVEGTRELDEGSKRVERLQFRWHYVEEWSGKHIHSLYIRELKRVFWWIVVSPDKGIEEPDEHDLAHARFESEVGR